MTRRTLREHCFKMLFCQDFYPEDEKDGQLALYFEAPLEDEPLDDGGTEILHDVSMSDKKRDYLIERARGIMARIPDIDALINSAAQGWKTGRMGKAELAIIRLAVYEMRMDKAVPEKVAINEAVELARKYGGDESPGFVNGVLARVIRMTGGAGIEA